MKTLTRLITSQTTSLGAALHFAIALFGWGQHCWGQQPHNQQLWTSAGTEEVATPVFESGSDGYKVYRIPAIVQAENDDLLAFCEARQGGDASEIDLVMKRSTDGGKSWSKLQVVQASEDFLAYFGENPPAITVGNPAPVVDRLDPEHPGRIWLPFTLENDRVFVTFSDDHGVTWSERREITEYVKRDAWGWYATGPVHAIQLQHGPHRGRLVVPSDHRLGVDGEDRGELAAHAILSDDHGKTWRLGAIDETYTDGLNANETAVVELADGTLYFNTRDQHGDALGTRGEAWSRDGGETFASGSPDWKVFRPAPAVLDPPVVQCSLLRMGDVILFCGPDEDGPSGKGRSDLRLRYSTDDAKSWKDGPLVHVGPAAYSDLVQLEDELLGILFENGNQGQRDAYQRISFARLHRSHEPFAVSEERESGGPISLHPQNPHYFLYDGKPTVLVTSAEHYGAVINADFDYRSYLSTLAAEGMNYTRIFVGSYVEVPGSFGIKHNTLAPATGRFLSPWGRTEEVGSYHGEPKWDLSRWNPEYFRRLRDFIQLAQDNGVVVEVTLFCSTYQDGYWERHPFNPANNVNGLPEHLNRRDSNTLGNGTLTSIQKALIEKVVREVNEFDNVFFEIQNEPWADNPEKAMRVLRTLDPQPGKADWFKWAEIGNEAALEWQQEMAQTIVETEAQLPQKHLIAQNFCNFKHSLSEVDPNVSILNFHYVWPETVTLNYAWQRPICFDESGFAGSADEVYLTQAWQFMLAGGGMFNNLDYSFYVGQESGTGANEAPGGGSHELRQQLKYLRDFIEAFDFIRMQPDLTVVHHAPGFEYHAISEVGRQYAIFLNGVGSNRLELQLPEGEYEYSFVSPSKRAIVSQGNIRSKGTSVTLLPVPEAHASLGLRLRRLE